MTQQKVLTLLPGDGIGPEVLAQVEKLLPVLEDYSGVQFTVHHHPIGGASYDAHGVPITDEAIDQCAASDAAIMGSVGGPKWDDVDYDKRPEAGLLKLRKELDLFANLRPAIVFDALCDASSLKPEIVSGLDILIVRELTGGVYFGEPRGIETLDDGQRRGFNTQVYTTNEIKRVTEVAFDLARKRAQDGAAPRVCSCEKANVMESGKLWREEVTTLHKEGGFDDIELTHMYADNCAMQLLRAPKQFDVIVTDNLFGDILSDEAAMLTGSLGMLPSASLGGVNQDTGKRYSLYEPVHGSAPDIAGQDLANPMATILSFAMALRFSLDMAHEATQLEMAVESILNEGWRTADIQDAKTKPEQKIGTHAMGDLIAERYQHILKSGQEAA